MNYYTNNIRHVKGDTFFCSLVVEGLGQDLDAISFTCRENLNDDSEILFSSTLGDGISLVEYDETKDIREYAIRVAPSKTENLQSGTYYYDEEIRVNDDVFTIMKGKFTLKQDATRETTTPVDPEAYIKVILDEINGEVIGVSVINKTDYLSDTKDLIKDSLNNLGAEITNEDTFRSYASSIDDLYDEWPKVSDEDTEITLNNTKKGKMSVYLKGNTTQASNPTPSSPVDVNVVSGNNTITIGYGTDSEDYQINLGTLELCKIGNYQDYIYKENKKWYKYSAIGKGVLDGSESWQKNNNAFQTSVETTPNKGAVYLDAYSNYFTHKYYASGITTNIQNGEFGWNSGKVLTIRNDSCSTADDLKTWLASNNVKIYYTLETPTTNEITDTTLINQLEALKNAESYDEVTNISQVNNDEAFIISASALMKGGN